MRKLLLIVLISFSSVSFGQRATIVSALVKDANGTVYQNCRYSITFVNQSSLPGPSLVQGSVFQTDLAGIACDGFGNLSIPLWANSLISPAPSQWLFNVCDTTGKFCGSLPVTVSPPSGTQNISAALTPTLPLLPIAGGGNVIAGGNNAFTGNNTFAGSSTFSGTTATKNLNLTQFADQFPGATLDVKLNACLAAAVSVGGTTCDARGITGAQTIAAEVDIPAGMTLLVPSSGTWTVTITGGATSAFKMFDASTLNGGCNGNNCLIITLANAANVASMLTNNQISGLIEFKVTGLKFYNTLNGTVANAMVDFNNIEATTVIRDVSVNTFAGRGLWIHGAASVVLFDNFWVEGAFVAGAKPLVIESTGSTVSSISFVGGAIEHPGAGQFTANLDGHGAASLGPIHFIGTHFEGSNSDTTTSLIENKDAKGTTFLGCAVNTLAGGSTAYAFQLDETVAGQSHGFAVVGGSVAGTRVGKDNIRATTFGGDGPAFWFPGNPTDINDIAQIGGILFSNDQSIEVFGKEIIDASADFRGVATPAGIAGFNRCFSNGGLQFTLECNPNNTGAFPIPLTGNIAGTHADSGFIQSAAAAGCTTAASIGGICVTPTTITWPTAFADTNYKVACQGVGVLTNFPIISSATIGAAASITVQTMALTAAAASFGTINCIAIHN